MKEKITKSFIIQENMKLIWKILNFKALKKKRCNNSQNKRV